MYETRWNQQLCDIFITQSNYRKTDEYLEREFIYFSPTITILYPLFLLNCFCFISKVSDWLTNALRLTSLADNRESCNLLLLILIDFIIQIEQWNEFKGLRTASCIFHISYRDYVLTDNWVSNIKGYEDVELFVLKSYHNLNFCSCSNPFTIVNTLQILIIMK